MSLIKKIWHDENSEPPKNYLWAKGGKLFKNIDGQWKEVSKKDGESGSNTNGDSGGEDSFPIDVLLTGGKVVGFVDDHDYLGLIYNYDTEIMTIERDIIKPEDLLYHVKQNMNEYGRSGNYHVIYEYEPSLITLTPTMLLTIAYHYSENEGKESIVPSVVQTSNQIFRAVKGDDEYIAAYIGD